MKCQCLFSGEIISKYCLLTVLPSMLSIIIIIIIFFIFFIFFVYQGPVVQSVVSLTGHFVNYFTRFNIQYSDIFC